MRAQYLPKPAHAGLVERMMCVEAKPIADLIWFS